LVQKNQQTDEIIKWWGGIWAKKRMCRRSSKCHWGSGGARTGPDLRREAGACPTTAVTWTMQRSPATLGRAAKARSGSAGLSPRRVTTRPPERWSLGPRAIHLGQGVGHVGQHLLLVGGSQKWFGGEIRKLDAVDEYGGVGIVMPASGP